MASPIPAASVPLALWLALTSTLAVDFVTFVALAELGDWGTPGQGFVSGCLPRNKHG